MHKGFTLIELIVIIAIIGILATISIKSFLDYRNHQESRVNLLEIVSVISEARQKTISSETQTQFGVHFDLNDLVVFEGAIYNSSDVTNKIFSFNNTTLDTNFSDSSDELVFARLSGVSSATGTIDIFDSKLNSTTTITINSAGLIE